MTAKPDQTAATIHYLVTWSDDRITDVTTATSIRQTLNFRNITQLLAVVNIEENRVLRLVL